MTDHAAVYRDLRSRVSALVAGLDAPTLDAPVPATPDWSAHDLLAHVVGVATDVVEGRVDGAGTDPWTAVQVEARLNLTPADLLAEWDTQGAALEALMGDVPDEITGQIVFDAATHEHDLRHAFGAPGARDSDAVVVGWEWLVGAVGSNPTRAPIRLVSETGAATFGRGEPVATVRAARFELLRAATGRRSADQVRAYDWDGEPRPDLLLAASIFRLRAEPLLE